MIALGLHVARRAQEHFTCRDLLAQLLQLQQTSTALVMG